ncbi:hypothetical protein AB6A40_007481 [Gnathostoma spinigerum]|uniref:NadR/Ttd14 AAA domain-containing protein n=1 Tax=Gnathostoma spinigerum TaxID=75299 RepID=A0ABD6ENJ4_9BILA
MVNEVSAGKAKRIYKVVLTGGPCGGKTTGQDRLRTFFEGIGWQVYTVPETATILLGGGVKFSELSAEQAYVFQKDLLLTLMRIESVFFNQAMLSNAEKVLVICDRGAMDPSAYIDATSWKAYLNDLNLDQFTIRDNRYDQVIHMTTAADGAEEYYTLANNSIRKEGIEQAIKVDRLTRSAWLGHPRVDVIDNIGCKSFEDKIRRLIAAVCKRIGIQTQDRLAFNSRKRKWLVEAVDDAKMPHCEVFKVVHSYLSTEDPKSQVRLRSRTQDGHTTYTITTRQFDLSEPVETQMQITWREYNSYMKMADPYRAQINKLRKCFMFDGQVNSFELKLLLLFLVDVSIMR